MFKIKRGAEPVKAFTGLMAAILRYAKVPFVRSSTTADTLKSSAKLYDRHKSTLVKALSTNS